MELPVIRKNVTGTVRMEGMFNGAPLTESAATYSWPTFSGQMASQGNEMPPWRFSNSGGPWLQSYTKDLRSIIEIPVTTGFRRWVTGQSVIALSYSYVGNDRLLLGNLDSDSDLQAKGTTCIARVEPTNPAFGGAVALAELVREGAPRAVGSVFFKNQVRKHKALGDEYLNLQFGWMPIVRDVEALIDTVDRADQIIKSYDEGSGKKIRRRFVLEESVQTASGTCTVQPAPNPHSTISPIRGTGHWTDRLSTKTWFSGAFRYYFPQSSDSSVQNVARYAATMRKLYGLEITPEVVWNLAPWSWAADWFGNIGDVMHNISAIGRDGLVLQYGYVMQERKLEHRVTYKSPHGNYVRELTEVSRKRLGATPYGFGVDLDALSAKQISILIALGLSRS